MRLPANRLNIGQENLRNLSMLQNIKIFPELGQSAPGGDKHGGKSLSICHCLEESAASYPQLRQIIFGEFYDE
jgi:hypothetical protein